MARRKKSSINPVVLISSLAAVGLAGGGYFLFGRGHTDAFGGFTKLDPAEYRTNSNSLQGNTYVLTGTISERLKYTDQGRLYSVAAKSEKGGDPVDVGVFFPASFASETIQTGQEMTLKVEVERTGLLRVTELKKS
jgi:hypothetical protein